jgi:predicted DNA binding CopG/RHH family protein
MEVKMDQKMHEKKPSAWSPFINQVLDEEELQIERDIAAGLYAPAMNMDERRKDWQEAAASMQKKIPITVRVQQRTIDGLKIKALAEGIPYQTLVSSVLHKFATGRLKDVK